MRVTPIEPNVAFTFRKRNNRIEEPAQPQPRAVDKDGLTFKGILDNLENLRNQLPYYRNTTSFTGHWPPYYKEDNQIIWLPKQVKPTPDEEEKKGQILNFIA